MTIFGKTYSPDRFYRHLSDPALIAAIITARASAQRSGNDHDWSRLFAMNAAAQARGIL